MADARYTYDGRSYGDEAIGDVLARALGDTSTRTQGVLRMVDGCDILDVGCGLGDITFRVAQADAERRVLGVDILETSIEIARDKLALPNLRYEVGDILEGALPPASFDCILWLETIEHVERPTDYLAEFRRLLRPSGALIVSTPNAFSYNTLIYYFWRGFQRRLESIKTEPRNTGTQLDHIYNWDLFSLTRLLERSQFTLVEYAFVGAWQPFGRFAPRELKWLARAPLLQRLCLNLLLKTRLAPPSGA